MSVFSSAASCASARGTSGGHEFGSAVGTGRGTGEGSDRARRASPRRARGARYSLSRLERPGVPGSKTNDQDETRRVEAHLRGQTHHLRRLPPSVVRPDLRHDEARSAARSSPVTGVPSGRSDVWTLQNGSRRAAGVASRGGETSVRLARGHDRPVRHRGASEGCSERSERPMYGSRAPGSGAAPRTASHMEGTRLREYIADEENWTAVPRLGALALRGLLRHSKSVETFCKCLDENVD